MQDLQMKITNSRCNISALQHLMAVNHFWRKVPSTQMHGQNT